MLILFSVMKYLIIWCMQAMLHVHTDVISLLYIYHTVCCSVPYFNRLCIQALVHELQMQWLTFCWIVVLYTQGKSYASSQLSKHVFIYIMNGCLAHRDWAQLCCNLLATASLLFKTRLESCQLIFTGVDNNHYVTSQCMSWTEKQFAGMNTSL